MLKRRFCSFDGHCVLRFVCIKNVLPSAQFLKYCEVPSLRLCPPRLLEKMGKVLRWKIISEDALIRPSCSLKLHANFDAHASDTGAKVLNEKKLKIENPAFLQYDEESDEILISSFGANLGVFECQSKVCVRK